MDDNSRMPFGAHRGELLKDVPDKYLLWLYEEESDWVEDNHPELLDYIEHNLDQLED